MNKISLYLIDIRCFEGLVGRFRSVWTQAQVKLQKVWNESDPGTRTCLTRNES